MNEEPQATESAVMVRDPNTSPPEKPALTPAQARIESVAAALDAAYRNASTLKLTPEEAQALADDFPDEAFSLGAGGDANLVYIEHAYLRQRLNKVLGVGAAIPIRRREWAEEFTYYKDRQEKRGVRVYVDLALLVRGCLVGEAIGDAVYYPDNAKQNYSDALESAKSGAFRRCCKEFGVGLQAWMKGWCEGWKERQRDWRRNAQERPPAQRQPEPLKTPPRANSGSKQASSADVLPKRATEKMRTRMLDLLCAEHGDDKVIAYCRMMNECTPDMWPLDRVPTDAVAMTRLKQAVGDWWRSKEREEAAIVVNIPEAQEDELPPEIANVVWHIPPAGVLKANYTPETIGILYAKRHDPKVAARLFGHVNNYDPSGGWTDSKGVHHEPSQQDLDLRKGLDDLADFLEAKKQTEMDLTP